MRTETEKERDVQRQALRRLSKREIDHRIERVMSEVASLVAGTQEGVSREGKPLRPRWITPRDLVEQMRKFMVYN